MRLEEQLAPVSVQRLDHWKGVIGLITVVISFLGLLVGIPALILDHPSGKRGR